MIWLVAIAVSALAVIAIAASSRSGEYRAERLPLVRSEHFEPADAIITLTDAKKFYRQYLKKFTNQDREDIAEAVRMFAEEVADTLQDFKQEAANCDAEARQYRDRIATLKEKLVTAPDDSDLLDTLEEAEMELEFAIEGKREAVAEGAALQKDKRAFLIDYINREFHGPDWRNNASN